MPIDARISMGLRPQTYDAFAAYDTGRQNEQTFRTNQMAQQAAQATAARNAMVRERAATVDYGDRNSVNEFIRMAGPDAAPYLEAAGAGDTLFNARAAEARAGGEYARKARGEDRGFMQSALAAVYNDPSDTSIAAVRAQALAAGIAEADFDAYASRFLAAPVEQRRALLANELATTPEGLKLLERFTPAYDMQNAGGSIVPVQTNPLAPGATPPRPITVTADPTKYTDFPTPEGITRVYADGRSEILRGPTGNPLMPAPTREERQDADAAAAAVAAAPQRLESAQNLTRLIDDAAANTNYWTAGLGSITAVVPGTPAADLAGTMESIKSNLAFDRLQQMRDESRTGGTLGQIVLRELDMLASVWASTQQSQSPPQLRENLAVLRARSEALVAAYQAMIDAGAGGGGDSGDGSPPRVTTRAQYDELASGAPYIDPNGVRRTKQ
jgi:hypothetical protein